MALSRKPPQMPTADVPIGYLTMPDGRRVEIKLSDAWRRYLDELKIYLLTIFNEFP